VGWFQANIWNPIFLRQGYNPYTTLLMAFGYALLVFAFWKVARRWKQKDFRKAFLPWLVFAGLLRFADGSLIAPSPLTATPGIYIAVPLLFLAFALSDLEFAKEVGYLLAVIFAIASIQILRMSAWRLALLSTVPMAVSYFAIRNIPWMRDPLPWMSHVFEAWISGFGVMAGLFEEHVVAKSLMSIHPLIFSLLKTLLLVAVFYLIKDEKGEEGIFLRTAIMSLGMAAGVRNLMEMLSL